MGKAKQLTSYEKGRIDGLDDGSRSYREIALLINRSKDVVRNYIKDKAKYGQNWSGGRPKATTAIERKKIIAMASNKIISSKKIKDNLGLTCSRTTVCRVMSSSEVLRLKKMKKQPNLTNTHKANRLIWAKKYFSWTEEWRSVIFTDEKKFNLDGPDGFRYYWHNIRMEEQFFSKRQMGGGSLMLWCGVGWNGKTAPVVLKGKQKASDYVKTLENHLVPFAHEIAYPNWILQQDLCTIHTSRTTKKWLEDNHIHVLDWASCSPDMNIIENIWALLSMRVYQGGRTFKSKKELEEAIFKCWHEITQEEIRKYFDSMPNRLFELVSKSGGKTHY